MRLKLRRRETITIQILGSAVLITADASKATPELLDKMRDVYHEFRRLQCDLV